MGCRRYLEIVEGLKGILEAVKLDAEESTITSKSEDRPAMAFFNSCCSRSRDHCSIGLSTAVNGAHESRLRVKQTQRMLLYKILSIVVIISPTYASSYGGNAGYTGFHNKGPKQ